LRKEKYDLIIDLHNNFRSQMLKFRLGVTSKRVDKLNIYKFLLTRFKINKLPDIHIVDRYFSTIKHLNVNNDNKGLDFFLPANDLVDMSLFPKDYIVFVIGGQHATKMLPNEKIISICRKINKPILLIGGPDDIKRGEKISNNTKNTFNTCGSYTVIQSAFLIKHSAYVITHDTGMMHIAAAFKKKIYSVWGNTIPEFGMYPYMASGDSKIIEVPDLECRPCSKIGYEKCPKGHFRCMQQIDEDLFFDE